MRTLKVWPLVMACIASFAMPVFVHAQQSQPAPPPPAMEKLEEGEAPAITIRKSGGETKTTEKRVQGKVKEIKVQSGSSTYYVKPNEPAGTALPGDAESSITRPAQWQVKEFNLGGPRKPSEEAAAQTPATLPPAPSVPAKN